MDFLKPLVETIAEAFSDLDDIKRKQHRNQNKRTLDLMYQECKIDADIPMFRFAPDNAQIMQAKDENLHENGDEILSRQIYARNRHGEYFYILLRSDSEKYLKHISHTTARVVLGSKYIAPIS